LDLLPKLKEDYSPSIVDIINRSAKLIQGADRIIHDYVRTHLPSILVETTNDSVTIKEALFKTFDEFIRGEMLQTILMKYFRIQPPSMKTIDRILKLSNSDVGAICEVSKSIIAVRDRDVITIARKRLPNKVNEKIERRGKFRITPNEVIVLKEVTPDKVEYQENPNVEYVDADKLTETLTIRNWEHSDDFAPLGVRGKMKISDFLTNEKVSVLERPNVLVLLNGNDDVIWTCKYRISDKYKVTKNTKHVIRIEIKEDKK
jgi:tRNA(Ile)-lysidine synthase